MVWIAVVLTVPWWALGLMIGSTLLQARRVRRLRLPRRADWPSVAVIVPARNEADTLLDAMERRLASDYPDLRVILVEDRSTDATPAVADALAATDGRVHVLHVDALPERWLGKIHALHVGARAADADWLLFSDADVAVEPGTLRRVVHRCESDGLDVLAALPTFRYTGVWMDAVYAVMLSVLVAGMRVRAVEDPSSDYGAGVGAFTLVRREALARSPGFQALRMEVADDLALGRMLKRSGARCTIMNGAGAIAVALYRRVGDFIRGAEKNAWAVAANFSLARGLAVGLGFLAMELSPLAVMALAATWGVWLYGVAVLALAVGSCMLALHVDGRAPWGGLLYPLGALIFGYGSLRGTVLGWWRGGLQWRDTFYPTEAFVRARAEAAKD